MTHHPALAADMALAHRTELEAQADHFRLVHSLPARSGRHHLAWLTAFLTVAATTVAALH